jgi:hypothetical protein
VIDSIPLAIPRVVFVMVKDRQVFFSQHTGTCRTFQTSMSYATGIRHITIINEEEQPMMKLAVRCDRYPIV